MKPESTETKRVVTHSTWETSRKVIGLQLITTIVVAAAFAIYGGEAFISAMYGGLTSVSTALLLNRTVSQANRHVLTDPKKSMMLLYVGAVQRFVFVSALLALGIGVLGLQPIGVVATFALTYVAYFMTAKLQARAPAH